jgi:DNA-binding NtrC family response regulator
MAMQARNTVSPGIASARPLVAEPPPPQSPPQAGLLRRAIVASDVMSAVLGRIRLFAPADTVVFEGDTGTGKSYLAEVLHQASGRPGAFVDVSAGEFEPGLALDQFFGHVRGAFTGAMMRHRGLFADAEGGTLLIDEFQLLERSQQAMLLRALERRVYRPIGYERDLPLTCSVVVGVEDSLDRLVKAERMAANLRSRLGHCIVRVPTLEQRREEIASFAQHFLAQCPVVTHAADGPTRFAVDALGVLEVASYPANLRDLREVVKAGYLLARGEEELRVKHLPEWVRVPLRYDRRMDAATKRRLAEWAMRTSGGHAGRAADRIGAHRNTIATLVAQGREEGRKRQAGAAPS